MTDKQRPSFLRVLGRFDVFALAFGAMIGWGWVVLTNGWIAAGGAGGAMAAFLIGGAIVLLVGLTYAELTSAMPKVGGEHVYSFRGLGVTASFICTWAIVLGYVSVVAFEAVALPTVLEHLGPGYSRGRLWTVAGWEVKATWALVGVAGSVGVGAINYWGVRPAARLQMLLVGALALSGGALIAGAIVSPPAPPNSIAPLFRAGAGGVLAVLVATPFMFVGFDVIPQAAEEIRLPFRTIGRVLLLSVALAVGWYVLIIFAVARSLDSETLATSQVAAADAMAAVFGSPWAGKLLVMGGVAGILTSWNSFYIGATRAIYAMAHARMLPEFLARLHPRHRTPSNAILLVGALSCIAPFFGRPMLVWLVDAGGLGITIAWTFVALSFLELRRREPNMPRPFRAPCGRAVGWTAVVLSLAMISLFVLPMSPSSLIEAEWAILIGWSALGALFYGHALRRHGIGTMRRRMQETLDAPEG